MTISGGYAKSLINFIQTSALVCIKIVVIVCRTHTFFFLGITKRVTKMSAFCRIVANMWRYSFYRNTFSFVKGYKARRALTLTINFIEQVVENVAFGNLIVDVPLAICRHLKQFDGKEECDAS